MRLMDFLADAGEHGRIPFHMPGHLREPERFDWLGGLAPLDFTEIDGLDDLHAPEGILRDAMTRAAERYGAERTFFLVGGSTVGILASVTAVCRASKKERPSLLMARSCHKSVWHAAMLNRADLRFVQPDAHPLGFCLDVKPEAIARAIRDGSAPDGVILTSPTYDGVVSDVAGIAEICHRAGVPLIVDAAHGAHLGFLDPAVPSPVSCGADWTVMSLHKTLPSLTQTGLLHVRGPLADPALAEECLGCFETSSPSYPLMASIDGCVGAMGDPALFANWRDRIAELRAAAGDLFLRPSGVFAYDESKLLLAVDGMSGPETAAILRGEYGIEPEMISPEYLLLMTGAGIGRRHVDALLPFLERFRGRDVRFGAHAVGPHKLPPVRMPMDEAIRRETEDVALEDAEGRIAATILTVYPPGIPLVVPGEEISRAVIDAVRDNPAGGGRVLTSRGTFDGTVTVCAETEEPT